MSCLFLFRDPVLPSPCGLWRPVCFFQDLWVINTFVSISLVVCFSTMAHHPTPCALNKCSFNKVITWPFKLLFEFSRNKVLTISLTTCSVHSYCLKKKKKNRSPAMKHFCRRTPCQFSHNHGYPSVCVFCYRNPAVSLVTAGRTQGASVSHEDEFWGVFEKSLKASLASESALTTPCWTKPCGWASLLVSPAGTRGQPEL